MVNISGSNPQSALTTSSWTNALYSWLLNGAEYRLPQTPSIYQALTSGESAVNPSTYGNLTNAFVLNHNEVIEIVLYNGMSGRVN